MIPVSEAQHRAAASGGMPHPEAIRDGLWSVPMPMPGARRADAVAHALQRAREVQEVLRDRPCADVDVPRVHGSRRHRAACAQVSSVAVRVHHRGAGERRRRHPPA